MARTPRTEQKGVASGPHRLAQGGELPTRATLALALLLPSSPPPFRHEQVQSRRDFGPGFRGGIGHEPSRPHRFSIRESRTVRLARPTTGGHFCPERPWREARGGAAVDSFCGPEVV